MNTLGKKITTTKISKMEAFPFFHLKFLQNITLVLVQQTQKHSKFFAVLYSNTFKRVGMTSSNCTFWGIFRSLYSAL